MIASAHGEQPVDRYLFTVGIVGKGSAGTAAPYFFEPTDGFQIRAGFEFDALIGMDILSQCELTIDRNSECILRFG